MFQAIIFIYVIIKWVGAWSLFDGAVSVVLFSGMCIFAIIGILGSLIKPMGLLRVIGALVNGGESGYGALLPIIFWPLSITLYILGLTDWLVWLRILESNKGYIMSGKTPSLIDIILLLFTTFMFISPILRVRKLMKNEEP